MDKIKEEIWALEEEYFTSLYKADYDSLLRLVHSKFFGWPSSVSRPVDKEGSERFMKQLVPKPTACTFKIEQEGIRLVGEVALTQYTIRVNDPSSGKTFSTRITHTWVNDGGRWLLLGGMSYEQ